MNWMQVPRGYLCTGRQKRRCDVIIVAPRHQFHVSMFELVPKYCHVTKHGCEGCKALDTLAHAQRSRLAVAPHLNRSVVRAGRQRCVHKKLHAFVALWRFEDDNLRLVSASGMVSLYFVFRHPVSRRRCSTSRCSLEGGRCNERCACRGVRSGSVCGYTHPPTTER